MSFWPVAALVIVSAMWGGHAVVGKAVEAHIQAVPLTVWRFTLGALCYLPWFHRLGRLRHLSAKLWLHLIVAGLCSAVLYPILYYQSLRLLSPVENLLLVNTSPFIAAIFSRVLFRERLSTWTVAGIGVAFFGIVTLVFGQWSGSFSWLGIVLVLLSATAFAGYTVASRQLFQTLPLFDVLVSTSIIGAIGLWLTVPFLSSPKAVFHVLTTLSPSGWLELLYIVVIVSTVAYVLYGYGLARLPSGIASAITFYPQALFAAIIQWLWFGDAPSVWVYVSAVFILGGTTLMRYGERRASAMVSAQVGDGG